MLLGTMVAMAAPASAATGVVVCAVAGTVNVDPGVGRIPPGSNTDGTYTFEQVALVCVGVNDSPLPPPAGAGTMTGVGTATSAGGFGVGNCEGEDLPLIGSFCGTYDATNFTAGGECHGTVGGDEVGSPVGGDWSLTFGPLILGGITCDSGSYAGGWGAIALVAVPNPLALDGQVAGTDLPPGECEEPNQFPRPAPEVPDDPAAIWFCQIAIAGVTVMQSVV
ncbi:MAG TPA: hypothetical protein VF230_16860 [Acidimicrobiales bacterium]